jgi:hypothetical protein
MRIEVFSKLFLIFMIIIVFLTVLMYAVSSHNISILSFIVMLSIENGIIILTISLYDKIRKRK